MEGDHECRFEAESTPAPQPQTVDVLTQFLHNDEEPAVILENIFELREAVEMGLLQFLIDHDFILCQFGLAFAVGFGHNHFSLVVSTFL